MTSVKEILEKMYNIDNLNSPKLAELELIKAFRELSDEDVFIKEFNEDDNLPDVDIDFEFKIDKIKSTKEVE